MTRVTCPKCHQAEHHLSTCPETRWPDGHVRGSACGVEDLPALKPLQDPRTYRFSNTGGLSPIGIEFAAIFSTLERRVERDDDGAQGSFL